MRKHFDLLIDLFIGSKTELSMEERVLNSIYFLSVTCSFVLAITFQNSTLSEQFIYILYIVGVICLVGFYISRVKAKYQAGLYLMLPIQMCITFFDWKENGGIRGTIILTLATAVVMNIHIFPRKLYRKMAIGTFTYVFLLIFLEIQFPEIINFPKGPITAAGFHWIFMLVMIFFISLLFKDEDFRRKKVLIDKEKELSEALEREKELNMLKSKFVSMVSHQFKTPLTVIHSSTELLHLKASKTLDDDSMQKCNKQFENVFTSINNITQMMDRVLAYHHLESGQINFFPSKQSLSELIIKSVKHHPSAIPFSQRKIIFNGEEKLVEFDSYFIVHCVDNLLSNAIKYGKKGEFPIVEISYENSYVKLNITDHGIGIPKEDIPRLFDAFYRAKNVDNIKGTGVGLSVVKQFVELHGGSIFVVSEVKKMTIFSIVLPYSQNTTDIEKKGIERKPLEEYK
ncbi:sensor histidine kinase [Sediminitomix flava]|uniref:histidine kinase n=1 Tax=Sediminitomix flava TaxID=379075 RepID=A0A315ZE56_SEDFL|nr:HAMP domain-containing sensor histidine kinase [Sediminitomix flava]PWJ43896.1 signal transduction histidine kinase [Sediminitomix flava]